MIQWICRTEEFAIGVQRWAGHSTVTQPAAAQSCGLELGRPGGRLCRTVRHSYAAVVRWTTAARRLGSGGRHRRSSA
jgi:hypothetical protein